MARKKKKRILKKVGGKIKKAGKKVGKSVKKAGKGVGKAVKKTSRRAGKTTKKVGKGIKKTALKTGKGISKSASKTGKGVAKAAKKTSKKIGKTANKVGKGVGGAARKVGKKIKETDVSISRTSGINISNAGANEYKVINKILILIPGHKNLLVRRSEKWRKLLFKSLMPNSSTNSQKNYYYINGLATNLEKGLKNIRYIKNYFDIKDGNIKLVFNPTLGEGADFVRILADLPEAKKDYDWFLSTAEGKDLDDFDLNWFLSNPLKGLLRKPIENPVTIGLICLLYVGKHKNAPLNLIASSQGSLIVFNAIAAFIKLNRRNLSYLKSKVKLLNIACVIPKKRYDFLNDILKNRGSYSNPKDPIAGVVGLKTKIKNLKNADFKTHSVNWYLPHKENFISTKKDGSTFSKVKRAYKSAAEKSSKKTHNLKDGKLIRIERFVSYKFFK